MKHLSRDEILSQAMNLGLSRDEGEGVATWAMGLMDWAARANAQPQPDQLRQDSAIGGYLRGVVDRYEDSQDLYALEEELQAFVDDMEKRRSLIEYQQRRKEPKPEAYPS